MKKIFLWIVIILAVIAAVWYFTKGRSYKPAATTTETTQVSGTVINIKDSAFSPDSLTVKAGETITVTNNDFTGHSVTADDGSFDTGVLGSGQSGSFTAPTKPGTYAFHCQMHPTIMKGTLIVK